jgi:hypothetical protein
MGWRCTPAGMERGGGAAEVAAGTANRPGRVDQRLECGVEFRGGSGADGVSCALAFDSTAGGGLRGAAGWGAGGDCGEAGVLIAL